MTNAKELVSEELPVHEETHCVRLGVARDVKEHLDCPYCHGKAIDVANGPRKDFCSFRPGEDPINFGFPGDTSRNTES